MSSPAYAEPLLEPFALGIGRQNIEVAPFVGVGSDVVFAIGRRFRVRPIAVHFTATASAAVADRFAVVQYERADGSPILTGCASSPLLANQSVTYSFNVGAMPGGASAAGFRVESLPSMFLEPTRQIRVTLANFDGADVIGDVTLVLEEFPTDPAEYRVGAKARRRGA